MSESEAVEGRDAPVSIGAEPGATEGSALPDPLGEPEAEAEPSLFPKHGDQEETEVPAELPATSGSAAGAGGDPAESAATDMAGVEVEAELTGTPVPGSAGVASATARARARAVEVAYSRPAPSLGPVGTARPPALVALLSIVTLGIYSLVWHFRINSEMSDFDPRMHVHPRKSTWALVVPWAAGMLITLAGAARIVLPRFGVTIPGSIPISTGLGYLLLGALPLVPYLMVLLPFSLIALTMTTERLRVVEDRVGVTPDLQARPASLVWWVAVPLVGGLILVAREQAALNSVWRRATLPGSSSGGSSEP